MAPEAQTEATAVVKIVNVPITKGKTTLAVNLDEIPDDVYTEIVLQGLKVLLNRGTSKVTKETYPKAEELTAKAIEVANAQLEACKTSKIKFTGGKKKSSATGAVMTEARRLAKALVKDELKRLGYKISHIEAKEITAYAQAYLDGEHGPAMIEKAKANLAERESITGIGDEINLKSIKISDTLVAKANAKKSKDGTLSRTQAGKVKAKTKGEQHAVH